jgi:hypothetical protein
MRGGVNVHAAVYGRTARLADHRQCRPCPTPFHPGSDVGNSEQLTARADDDRFDRVEDLPRTPKAAPA